MKKALYFVNLLLLGVNMAVFVLFCVYALVGSPIAYNFLTDSDVEFMLLFAIVFEIGYIIISKIISLPLKVDLTYKGLGEKILQVVPKRIVIAFVIIGIALIVFSIILKISSAFIIAIVTMLFGITIEFGITILFKDSRFA